MTPAQKINAATERLTLSALRVAASVPVASQRMSALTQALAATDPTLASDVAAAIQSGRTIANSLRYGYSRYLIRQAATVARGGSLGDLTADLQAVSEGAEQVGEAVDAIADAATSVIDGVGAIYNAGQSAFGGGTPVSTLDVGPAGSLTMAVQRAPVEWEASWAAQRAQAALETLLPSTGLFGTLPTWLIGAGIGGTVYGVYKLFFAKKRRKAKAK